MKLYVTYVFLCPRLSTMSHLPNSSYFRIHTPRTLMIQLRSRDAKMLRTRSTSLLRYLCHRTSNLEAPGSIGRPQYHWPRVIMASRCLILSLDRISFLTPLLLSGSLIYLQAIMAMYHTFSNHTTAWESADLQCFKFPLTVCVFIYRSLETVYTIYAVWTRTP